MPKDQDFVEWVSGNLVIKDSLPIAHRYGGYQFGYWVTEQKFTKILPKNSNLCVIFRQANLGTDEPFLLEIMKMQTVLDGNYSLKEAAEHLILDLGTEGPF